MLWGAELGRVVPSALGCQGPARPSWWWAREMGPTLFVRCWGPVHLLMEVVKAGWRGQEWDGWEQPFRGGLSSSLVAWYGSGGISMSAGMTTERRHVKVVLLSPAFGWASRVPPRATRDHRAWAVGASTSA